jgi:hypothetical protein
MLARVALYATLGTLLSVLGQDIDGWGFWCVLALFWAGDVLARKEGQDHGIWITITLPADQLAKLKKEIDRDLKDSEG